MEVAGAVRNRGEAKERAAVRRDVAKGEPRGFVLPRTFPYSQKRFAKEGTVHKSCARFRWYKAAQWKAKWPPNIDPPLTILAASSLLASFAFISASFASISFSFTVTYPKDRALSTASSSDAPAALAPSFRSASRRISFPALVVARVNNPERRVGELLNLWLAASASQRRLSMSPEKDAPARRVGSPEE